MMVTIRRPIPNHILDVLQVFEFAHYLQNHGVHVTVEFRDLHTA